MIFIFQASSSNYGYTILECNRLDGNHELETTKPMTQKPTTLGYNTTHMLTPKSLSSEGKGYPTQPMSDTLTVKPPTPDIKNGIDNYLSTNQILLALIVAVGMLVLGLIILLVVCIKRRRTNERKSTNTYQQNPSIRPNNEHSPNPQANDPEVSNTNADQDQGVEYAEINMKLLAPRPEQKPKENANDQDVAPLIYAELAFHDNNKRILI